MSGHIYKLTIYPERDHFSRCYAVASEVARRLGFDPDEEFRFAVCVSEAYTNAFIHGNKLNPSKSINVIFTWDEESVRVDIEDNGEAKPEALHLDDSRPDIDCEKSSGRGVGIMKLFADRIEVEERQEGGLRVSISFRLRRKSSQLGVLLQNQTEEYMEIRVTENEDYVTLSLKGRLDFASSTNLKEEILKRVAQGRNRIILNLAQIDFINSSGLGTLVSILKEVRLAKGRLLLSNLASYVEEIFEITQLSHIFEIHPSEAEAHEALTASRVNVS